MEEENEVDPRVKGELDSLNQATDEINKLENEICDERRKFKTLLSDATQQLLILGKKYGKSIDRARPYYDVLKEVKQAQSALQRAVHNFQKSNGVYRAAKETISLAEQRLSEFGDKKVDTAWQEMLNLQTIRFMEAEGDRTRSEKIHEQATRKYEFLNKKAKKVKSKHKISTAKAKSYFDSKEKLEFKLQKQRQRVDDLRKAIDASKAKYKNSLANLERISLEIHEKRQDARLMAMLGDRTDGEGSENPDDDVIEMTKHTEFDLIGPKYYDDVNELEADLDGFSFDDYISDDESYTSSEEGSVSSESGGRHSLPTSPSNKRHSMHRMMSYRRQISNVSIEEDPLNALGGSPRSRRSRRELKPPKQDSLVEEDDAFENSTSHVNNGISEENQACQENNNNDVSKLNQASRDTTYDTLHGVSTVTSQSKNNERDNDVAEYDIFDDLC